MSSLLPPLPDESKTAEAPRRRATKTMLALAVLFVVVPFLFWRGTWFGKTLSEEETAQYLSDQQQPRHIQHALVQIGERMARGDPAVRRWYPQVAALTESPVVEIRITLAWVLGADNRAEEFHRALLTLLEDSEPLVRRNAALSLVRFGDESGREELLAVLRPYSIPAPADGIVRWRLQEDNPVDRGSLLGWVDENNREPTEIRSPVVGGAGTETGRGWCASAGRPADLVGGLRRGRGLGGIARSLPDRARGRPSGDRAPPPGGRRCGVRPHPAAGQIDRRRDSAARGKTRRTRWSGLLRNPLERGIIYSTS